MQKDYIAVFYLQKNYVKFDIFRTLTTSRLSILTEIPFTTINVKGSILIRHMSFKDCCLKRRFQFSQNQLFGDRTIRFSCDHVKFESKNNSN